MFSSRKLEPATYDLVAFRFIAANDHPDHDTIATFRRRFLKEIEGLFVQVLALAREIGMLKLGTVALDGTKIHANASRHSALSYEHAGKIEAQLKAEVAELAPNDKQQIEPMLGADWYLARGPGQAGDVAGGHRLLQRSQRGPLCAAAQIDPMIAQGRQSHYPPLSERFAKVPSAPENPTPLEAMSHRLQTPEGKMPCASRSRSRCSGSSNR